MRFADILVKKRDGGRLSSEEISFFVSGISRGIISDDQASAFLMALFIQGLDSKETACLTDSMSKSGDCFDLAGIPGIKVDKHSTGGVGDGISLALAPLAAACGAVVPMVAGRSLGHTGGTIDKLESIPGFKTQLTQTEFISQLQRIGVVIMGQTDSLVPADKKIYALRDVTATIDSIPLITSSILSKKLAEGCDALVLDVKYGSGAFMQNVQDAKRLAQMMVSIGKQCNKKMIALLTNMDQPLGSGVGNALEVNQTVQILKGRDDALVRDWIELTDTLGGWMLFLAGISKDWESGSKKIADARKNGFGLRKFAEMVEAQGGSAEVCKNPEKILPRPAVIHKVLAVQKGVIQKVDAKAIGIAALVLGAGRAKQNSRIDPAAGILLLKKAGDRVEKGEPIAEIHCSNLSKLNESENMVMSGVKIGKASLKIPPLISAVIWN